MLKKYILDPSLMLQAQPIELKENLSYEEEHVEILDRREQVFRNKIIPPVKSSIDIIVTKSIIKQYNKRYRN